MESAVFSHEGRLFSELGEVLLRASQCPEHRRFPSRILQVIEGFLEASSILVLRGAADGRLHMVDGCGDVLLAGEEWSVSSEESLERKLGRVMHPRKGEQIQHVPLMRHGRAVGVFSAALPAARTSRDLQLASHLWMLAAGNAADHGLWPPHGDARHRDQDRLRGWAEMAQGLQSHIRQMLAVQESATEILLRAHEELRDSPVVQPLLHSLEEYRRLADRLRQLHRLLNTAPNFRPISMAAMVRLALQRIRNREAGVRIRTKYSVSRHSTADLKVLADPDEILPALMEVLGNAVEYGQGHPVWLDLTTRGGMATLAVRSQSTMSAQQQMHAFELFYSTHQDPARGLGLPIAQAIALLHRGSLHCSTSEHWTTAYFSLPLLRN